MCIINKPETEIHFHDTTISRPLTGFFGSEPSNLRGNSADDYPKVHQRGRSEAEVAEARNGIGERLHHDWTDSSELATAEQEYWDRH